MVPCRRYYVERAHKYGLTGPSHSVIYHEDSVRDPYGDRRGSMCAQTDAIAERMGAVQESAEDALREEETPLHEHTIICQWATRRKGGRVRRSVGSGGVCILKQTMTTSACHMWVHSETSWAALWGWTGWHHLPGPVEASARSTRLTPRTWPAQDTLNSVV